MLVDRRTPRLQCWWKVRRSGAWEIGSVSNDYGFRTWVDSTQIPSGLKTLALTPTSEWDASLSTSGESAISTAGDSMSVDRAPAFDDDERGLIEFNAAGLPATAKIRSAKLTFNINQRLAKRPDCTRGRRTVTRRMARLRMPTLAICRDFSDNRRPSRILTR